MTSDKQSHGHLAKPLTPALSAAFHRTQSKSPLTPRLATPAGYRTPNRSTPSEHPSSALGRREPEPSLLSANVTPRSGSRASRRDGTTSSPSTFSSNGTNSLHVSWAQPSVAQGGSQGRFRTERSPVRGAMLEPPKVARSKPVAIESNYLPRPTISSENASASPMFFHASDARSTISSSESDVRPKLTSKSASATTFVYANGQEERPAPASDVGTGPTPYKRRSLSRSVVSSKPASPSPRLRPARVNSNPRLSDGLTSQVSSQLEEPSEPSLTPQSPPLSTVSARPIPAVRHLKSSSVDSATNGTPPHPHHKEGLRPSPLIISPSEPKLDTSSIATDPLPGLRPRVFSNGSIASVDTHGSGMQSPSKSESGGPASNGVALNARTERKIMDLEISNSSLLAINRTLEREMRKQNAELRRYRRLSRSGRLSMAQSTRSASATLSIHSEVDEAHSERSSPRSSPEELSDLSDEEEDSMADSGVLSPADSQAEPDASHRPRDEKRFLLDLAKHQELLADSQRMNQSLKRCLGWTEELIKEGQRALEYRVHVSDVQLGGRVLAPEEMHDLNDPEYVVPALPSSGASETLSDGSLSEQELSDDEQLSDEAIDDGLP
ncbi:uncharacterized protein BP01DRAFT_358385 [Aspergillus saccharolyticus JOP 1030-1]|uniref:Uncharacterized protein n=1 Tax=Aspergillus saccharolyticus JOP 1030-1 TaxID=1450539 RepID=A0A318ZBE2_9EURO|nr:hypothetical protein BP01DRAFT_358385 [Aspergillus saccharolyticus JOP 1030-1]PYH43654.1 hypothetical protein BP01DRAFT_358385 [Aspergillus saccharolyticus JOP 1030-1]